jgi:hypothetical protein
MMRIVARFGLARELLTNLSHAGASQESTWVRTTGTGRVRFHTEDHGGGTESHGEEGDEPCFTKSS